jgi:predicted nucleic acid-binding protein
MGLHTYLDSSVIINLFSQHAQRAKRANEILMDRARRFIVGDYVWLEVLPKMSYNKLLDQVRITEDIFRNADYVPSTAGIIAHAKTLACVYGLSAVDALHVASAIAGHADELVTFEKPEKPFFRVPTEYVRLVSLYE